MEPKDIKALRESFQMTQEEFAHKLGLQTRGAVSKLESGAKRPVGSLLALLLFLSEGRRAKVKKPRADQG